MTYFRNVAKQLLTTLKYIRRVFVDLGVGWIH